MPQFTIICRVTLSGALMLVEADSPEEALAKAKANEWDDVEYGTAELINLEITGKPKADNE